jgi:C1A family cysteine protease
MLRRAADATIPLSVDLREWAGPVKDQGDEGSCTGHAFSSAREWISRKYYLGAEIYSPQFQYVCELIMQGNFPDDDGSDGQTGCESLIVNGVCLESDYPYVQGQLLRPTPAQYESAKRYTLGAYHGVPNADVAASVLGDPVPWPICIGFTVYESFESDEVASSGIMPVPASGEKELSGHEVLILGYDLAKQLALCQNSWGTDWGQKGFFWMPMEILDRPDTDMKIVHSGHPWG